MRVVCGLFCPPKTVAKIEKKMMGNRNVSACATRSRAGSSTRRESTSAPKGSASGDGLRHYSLSSLPVRWMKTAWRLGPRTSTSSTRPAGLRAARSSSGGSSAPTSCEPCRARRADRRHRHRRCRRSATPIVQRRVDAKRHEPVPADGLIDELRQRSRGDDLAVIDDDRARASRFGFLEMMRREQQRHAVDRSSASTS